MPAIILPTLGMAGGKWDSSLRSLILLDFFSRHSFGCFFCWVENNFPACIFKGQKGQKAGKTVAEGKVGVEEEEEVRVADMLIVRDKHFSAVVIRSEAVTSLAC